MYTVGAMSAWTVNGVVIPCCVASSPQVAVHLTEQAVVARRGHAVAARRCRLRPGEVVALLDGDDEQRVALVDPVPGQAIEERGEGLVIRLELGDVARLARSIGDVLLAVGTVAIVGIRDVAVGDRDSGLLHGRDVGQRRAREQAVETRKPGWLNGSVIG